MRAPSYRAVPPAQLRIEPLDGLTLLYHRASGITHILAPPAPQIIDSLADRAMTAAALLDHLVTAFALEDADPIALAARLDELVAAGLVIRE